MDLWTRDTLANLLHPGTTEGGLAATISKKRSSSAQVDTLHEFTSSFGALFECIARKVSLLPFALKPAGTTPQFMVNLIRILLEDFEQPGQASKLVGTWDEH